MESLNLKLSEVNKKFKTTAFTSGVINILILGLVFVFFSISFDLTNKLVSDFVNLNWATIFPSLIDLFTIAGTIFILKWFLNTLKKPDFLISINENAPEEKDKIETFLRNTNLFDFTVYFWLLVSINCFNLLINAGLEYSNGQFSPLNEWYFLSNYFTSLPIFPINLVGIIILIGLFLPVMLNYANYMKEISEISNSKKAVHLDNLFSCKVYRFFTMLILSIFCIVLSLLQKDDMWIFKYKNPIAQEDVLIEEIGNKNADFCMDTYKKLHGKEVLLRTEMRNNNYSGEYTIKKMYVITPELKEKIQLIQSKCSKN